MKKVIICTFEILTILVMRARDLVKGMGVPAHWEYTSLGGSSNTTRSAKQKVIYVRQNRTSLSVIWGYVGSQVAAIVRLHFRPEKRTGLRIIPLLMASAMIFNVSVPAIAESVREVYRVQEGDILDIHPLDQHQSDLYPIPPDGRLYMPQLGDHSEIFTLGKTLAEIGQALKAAQNLQTPSVYAVKYAGRSKGTVRVFGPAKVSGLKDSNDLLTIVSQCDGTESWNGNVSVTYPDTRKTIRYNIRELIRSRSLIPYVPSGSSITFEKRFLNRALDPIKPASTWLGVLAAIALIAAKI